MGSKNRQTTTFKQFSTGESMKILRCLICFIAVLLNQQLFGVGYLDLEHYTSDFIIQTKQIHIPHYPYAFNPSIIRWKGKLLMSFRIIPGNKKSFNSEIGLIWLDDQFNPTGEAQLLAFRDSDSLVPSRAEDGRLVEVGSKLFLVYSDCPDQKVSKAGFRIHVAELDYNGKTFSILHKTKLTQYEGQSDQLREKNWVPFNYQNTLLLSYSIDPHLVFHPKLWSHVCNTVSYSDQKSYWGWGDLRGGTPALLIDGQYLAFFHSSIELATVQSGGQSMLHYFMGAYAFNSYPPFTVSRASVTPIIAPEFYSGTQYEHYWKPVQAIFPCGFLVNNDTIWVAYGRQDHEVWVVQLDKRGLMRSLAPTY